LAIATVCLLTLAPVLAKAGGCAYSGWSSDGCTANSGTFLIAPYYGAPNFYAFAAQSGQTWNGGGHPWNWNSPGIDYAVGPLPGVVLADPASTALPVGCSYQPTGSTLGGPRVYCKNASSPTFNGFDFSLHGCTPLVFAGITTGTISVQNSRFVSGPNCNVYNGSLLDVSTGVAGLMLKNDLFDEAFNSSSALFASTIFINTPTANVIVKYTAILNTSSRPISIATSGSVNIQDSVFVGFTLGSTANTGQHGELVERGTTIYQANIPLDSYVNNVIVIPASTNGVVTAPIYPNGVANKLDQIDSFVADHNVIITNFAGGTGATVATGVQGTVAGNVMTVSTMASGAISPQSTIVGLAKGAAATVLSQIDSADYLLSGAAPAGAFSNGNTFRLTTSAAIAEMSYAALYANVTVTNNFVDPTGAQACILDLGSAIGAFVITGNQSLVTGTPVNGIGAKGSGATCPPLY
jgi:hypothetical protein